MNSDLNKPDIAQAFDKYIDREYYKINKGFIFMSDVLLRSDTLKEWKEWHIKCESMPDKIFINGEEYTINSKEL